MIVSEFFRARVNLMHALNVLTARIMKMIVLLILHGMCLVLIVIITFLEVHL